jgi:LPS O-antigen subunit length determinant protein (WzzB/FepE family)
MATVNDTRAVTRQNARIKAELNEQAHAARMLEFDALLTEYATSVILAYAATTSMPGAPEQHLAEVQRTEARTRLRGYVQVMSQRIKVR